VAERGIPPLIVQKVSNHGVDNPIVARLALQTIELAQWLDVDKATKEEIFGRYLELQRRLLQCHEYHARLIASRAEALKETNEVLARGEYTVPAIMNLQAEVEGLLFAIKLFLRDVAITMNVLFENARLSEEAAVFWNSRGEKSAAQKWAEKTFGLNHHLTTSLSGDANWISELVKKRNAVEHPGGNSGALKIEDFAQGPSRGLYIPPAWYRVRNDDTLPKTDLYRDLDVALDNLLSFAEEMLIHAINARPMTTAIGFRELSPDLRNPDAPIRFIAVMATDPQSVDK